MKNTTKYSKEIVLLCLMMAFCFLLLKTSAAEEANWPGVDESVVEKYAKEHGREAMPPFINTDKGDLLLFLFLVAGVIGGFAGGYYWRILFVEKGKFAKNHDPKVSH